ncbi:MAG: S8 family serine peptidase [Candidatus Thermoplasmatota archaeon]|nr:S8 family serine peptidase [Candidatus Thermoplasmatota archaeon]
MLSSQSSHKTPLLTVLLLLLTSMSPLALGGSYDEFETREEPTIFVPGLPPLICEDGDACPTPDRGVGSWLAYSPDRDHNGMDDRLQRILDGEYESVSTTAIEGPDGRLTVAIHVDYAEHPDASDIAALKATLFEHGWIEEGAWFDVLESIHTISLDHVPLPALLPIWRLDGVVTVQQQNVMIPFLDNSVPAMKVRDSEVYQDTMQTLGYRGDDVVVAVLDTGVDNEHRSLNDFDDVNDDPDIDGNSYVDQKWVAGYDATSAFSNTSGTDDPDDSNGHGTHVAGTSIGTGSSDRTYVGVAPGAYLVDVKVLTDAGGTNAQNTLRGLQWAINNVDTDWGNNQSSNGIDILSMSYGSVTNPNSDDPGDNGTSAESSLVNQASDAGLICVIAMGNDGMRRVPSPASADSSIAIGAIDDKDTHDRETDQIASYSNWGPREDDGDSNDWDEMKPDVVAPGSGINAPRYEAGSLQLPNQPRPMADNSYEELSGTSMATPHVSGLIAIMLGIDDDLDLDDIRDLLRDNSELRGGAYDSDFDENWNEKYGFGIVDGSRILQNLTGTGGGGGGGGGGNNSTDPPPSGSGEWVEIESPVDGDWLIEGETYRVRGSAESDTVGADIEEVLVHGWYWYQEPGSPREKRDAFDWVQAVGTDNWSHNFLAQDWVDGDEITIEVKARDSTNAWSDTEVVELMLGSQSISIGNPSGQEAVSGSTTISGTFLSPNPISVDWRIGRGEWQEISVSSSQDYTTVDWSVNWDTTQLEDGFHRIAVQGRDQSGVISDELRRTVEVDNFPPAPDLSFFGSISVEEFGIPVEEAFVNTFLEVRADVRNNGDADAEDVVVHLREEGTKRSEATIPLIEPGQVVEVILYWNPMSSGNQQLEVIIDPGQAISESDRTDNSATITFPVQSRPDGVDLSIRPGSITTSPSVPRPNEPYTISIRVDNLGARDSEQVSVELSMMNEFGYVLVDFINASTIIGQTSGTFTFAGNVSDARGVSYRASIITSTDLVSDNNVADFVVVQDLVTLSGARTPALQSTHQIQASAGLGEDSLLFTSMGEKLFVHRMASDQSLYTCLELESEWIGDIAVNSYQGIVTVAWTRMYLDENSFIKSTVSYTTIDRTCQMTPRQDLMPGLLTAEGTYWGLDLDQKDDTVVLAGYHRDMVTGGTYQDITTIFLIETDSPLSTDNWEIHRNSILDIEMYPRSAPPLDVEIGDDDIHILYQNMRDDSTGEERLGMFYAHGKTNEQNWAFSIAVGDEATSGRMLLIENSDGSESIFTAWREGSDADAELITRISPPSWLQGVETRTPARGLSNIILIETDRGVQILYDAISPTGPKLHYGLLSDADGSDEMWLSDMLSSGVLLTAWRTDDSGELHFTYATSNGLRVRKMVEDPTVEDPDHGILDKIRLWLNLDESTFEALLKTVTITFCSLSLFVLFIVSSNRRRRGENESTEFVNENWVDLDTEDKSDEIELTPVVSLDEQEEESESTTSEGEESPAPAVVVLEEEPEEVDPNSNRSARSSRRERRAAEAEMKQVMEDMHKALEESGLPPLPAPGELPPLPAPGELPPLPAPGELPPLPAPGELPPLPAPGELPPLPAPDELPPLPDLPAPEIPVTCEACESSFTARANKARRVKCPMCGETVRL